jgi:predicted choloylglycine hydrolase
MPAVTSQVFSGSHYEIGIQQGRAVSRSIQKALAQIPHFEAVKLMKPRLLPASLFLMLAKRRATKLLTNDVFEHYPKQAQRLKGIAEGAGIDMPTALLLQSMEMLTGKPSFYVEACTSLGFSPQRTSTNETIVAKNFDYPNDFAPYHLTCETRPEEGYKTLGCKMGPQPGMLEGINEHGLAVTYNLAYTTETPSNFVPLSIVLQEMLETCKTTDEAARFMTQAKRGGHDALLMLADAEGSLKTVEITSNHAATRDMTNEQIVNTNHYLTPEMQQYEIPRNAIYSGKVAKEMLGTRVHESSEQRLERAQELLKGKTKIDENKIITVLRDHGKDNKPSMLTVCRHAEYASTLRSVIFYPNRKTIKVLYGKPCQNEYTEFKFS